jgi:hypothetical protein
MGEADVLPAWPADRIVQQLEHDTVADGEIEKRASEIAFVEKHIAGRRADDPGALTSDEQLNAPVGERSGVERL